MIKYDFTKEWIARDFDYVYSPNSKSYPVFKQEKDCIVNRFDTGLNDYEYISILTKQKQKEGVTVSTKCSFDSYGAPLIVFSDDVIDCEDGRKRYRLHFEVVAFEEGCNVWHIVPFPERTERPIKPTLIGKARFPVADGSKIELSTKIEKGKITVTVNGESFTVTHPEIPGECHVGITACEGINRFYSLCIE